METLTLKVDCVLFPKGNAPQPENGYAIISGTTQDKKTVTLKGSMPGVHKDAEISVSGEWRSSSYGPFFQVSRYEETMPTTLLGIRNYLSSGLIKGIGPSLAYLIVEKFKENTLDIIDKNPEKLREVSGIGAKKISSIIESWKEQKGIKDVMLFLKAYDVSNGLAAKIYKQYKEDSISILKSNPYKAAEDIDGVGFLTADNIALSMGLSRTSAFRIRAGLLFVLQDYCDKKGNVYCDKKDLVRITWLLLNHEIPVGAEKVEEELVGKLLDSFGDGIIKDELHPERIYLPAFYHSERNIAKRLLEMSSRKIKKEDSPDFDKIEAACGVEFDDVQKDAITLVSQSSVCVITGGPGTGKTTTMKGVIGNAVTSKKRVLLAAPTGRAAKRLAETTKMEAKTLHRLLEYKPGSGFTRNRENPLEGDLLVVDESSMIDLFLMNAIVNAVPSKMKVVLVGDADQLPSVGAGNVLRDVIASAKLPIIKLTRIFRQAQDSLIVSNAHAINNDRPPRLQGMLMPEADDFCFIERESDEDIQKDILTLTSKYIPEMFDIKSRDIQVLSPVHAGALGVDELNRLLQETLNKETLSIRKGLTDFRKGDKVMQTKNDYDNDVYNGDVGTVVGVDTEERILTVDFGGRNVEIDNSGLDMINLAYCTTIHKSQGSEYPVVVIPITMKHYKSFSKNMLYTAITRAKQRCVLVGSKRALMTMIGEKAGVIRNSALAEVMGKENM